MLIEVFTDPRRTPESEAEEAVQRFIAEKFLGHTFESEDELIALVQTWPAFAAECLGDDSLAAVYTKMVAVFDRIDPCIKWTGRLGEVAYLHEVVRIADLELKCKFFDRDRGRPCYRHATCLVVLDTARGSMRPSCEDHKDAEWPQPTQSTLTTLDPKLVPSS